jgi:hypothetical protein
MTSTPRLHCQSGRTLLGYNHYRPVPRCPRLTVEGSIFCSQHRLEAWMRVRLAVRDPLKNLAQR